MSRNGEQWSAVLECNNIVRQRLMTWELLLYQLVDGNCRSDKRLLAILARVLDVIEDDVERICAIEETGPFRYGEEKFPRVRLLVEELWREHSGLRAQVQRVRMELGAAPLPKAELVGRALHSAGMELAQSIRKHIRRNEEELIPALVSPPPPIAETAEPGGPLAAG